MILVIGASSFIGVYTVEELLKQNCEVLVTGRNDKFREYYKSLGVDYINLDISNKKDFEKLPIKDVEGVILLAGLLPANVPVKIEENENAADYFFVNTIGTINVLEYCRVNGIKRVISTASYADVFNSWSKDRPLTEDEPRGFEFIGDHAAYVISKNAASDVMEYYNQQHGMKNSIFRLPPVYGVGPHGSLYVNGTRLKSGLQIFIDKASTGEDLTIYGDGELSRDVVYVKDVAHAFYLAMKSERTSGLYNMTSGKAVTLKKQAEVISKIFAKNSEKISKIKYRKDVTNNTRSFVFSIDKARRDFEFVPNYSDFEKMMTDYKKDMDNNKFKDLFNY
ncbi:MULTISPECIES: NAD-dependent epimerase/dehydratase family protein [Paenibacillus]|uniref:Nucleoside-diphosphate sugar epimerase n=1 Tax=Paenibacillus odorifer TaxID=189426 RepID=A0A1R0X6V5_9BACL|nr:NAD(P)-dependent oxidoreductase [Paenibacillus odorifer]OMD30255.1 nucleoside-diphosphate sugar epimerase [Paenibacillus odorifer]